MHYIGKAHTRILLQNYLKKCVKALWPSPFPMGVGQYSGLGAYCDPHTASSGFLTISYDF